MTFFQLYDVDFIFRMREARVNRTTDFLISQGYIPSASATGDVWKARLENFEAELDLLSHFQKDN